jgi:hypothetical protein
MSSATRPETPPDATCRRFAFAIGQSVRIAERKSRRRAAVAHLFSYVDFFDVVDEWDDDGSLWVVVDPADAMPVSLARMVAEETTGYVRGSFRVDHSL